MSLARRPLCNETAPRRFASKLRLGANGCWEWAGYVMSNGYGRFLFGGRFVGLAHRFSYLYFVGPIPDGLEVDHLCRNRKCVNPRHLEAVDHKTNAHRGASPSIILARENRCARGHDISDAYRDRRGSRHCRECKRVRRAAS